MANFKIERRESSGVQIIDIEGGIDAFLVTKVKDIINDLIQEGKFSTVISFRGVDQINSTALGILVGRLRRVRMHGGDIKIISLSPEIRKVFDIMGASKIFDIHDSEEEAVAAFGE